jgi:carbonic anhydrase
MSSAGPHEQQHQATAWAQPRVCHDRRAHARAATAVPAPSRALRPQCIDPRTNPAQFLGLGFADAIVARTVGGRVTAAVIQDLSYVGYLVERKSPEGPYFEAAIIQHTDCGSGLLADQELRHGFAQRTGYDEDMLAELPVLDPAATVRVDIERDLSDPRISPHITVSGHVYDVDTGSITTIVEPVSPKESAPIPP